MCRTPGPVTVDGDVSDWDLSLTGPDFFASMHEGSDPDKRILSHSYVRYDCSANKIHTLVYRACSTSPCSDATSAIQSPNYAWARVEHLWSFKCALLDLMMVGYRKRSSSMTQADLTHVRSSLPPPPPGSSSAAPRLRHLHCPVGPRGVGRNQVSWAAPGRLGVSPRSVWCVPQVGLVRPPGRFGASPRSVWFAPRSVWCVPWLFGASPGASPGRFGASPSAVRRGGWNASHSICYGLENLGWCHFRYVYKDGHVNS
jgi:hypothetical protein